MPKLYVIAGCNGAGKTTASYTILPEMLHCYEFVNADEIAKGLSPFQPEKVAFESGRIMLHRIQELLTNKVDFAIETTLSSKTYLNTLKQAKSLGYEIFLIFFWLESIDLAKIRVQKRVIDGGHNIPEAIIERRYKRGVKNFFNLFMNQSDYWLIIDNSKNEKEVIAEKKKDDNEIIIHNSDIWKTIQIQNHEF